ncbi:hypothetical protein TNIN_103011 [Trichonephila inaurata madagascariensis]|uniref:Uncharacterized protein n=1 Tax=Trichonephila inaurata madagascariensis TaxID=2747483 RepID=A0A8X7CL34_9ARAC|nr:hypothetical protein TNIN_103011 [Trichonephila inaurata madagascariensis]
MEGAGAIESDETLSVSDAEKIETLLNCRPIVGIWSPVLNSYVRGRVILDSASQSHFMTLQFAPKLGLEKKKVSKIQALTANYQWKHISSLDNPADLISRGLNPSDLEHLEFWWSGPSSVMEEIMDDSRQNDLNPSEKELYLT